MSQSLPKNTAELGELFVAVTGDRTVTERQEEGASKRPLESGDDFRRLDDGLADAVGADLDAG